MKYTSAEAGKLVRKLEDRVRDLIAMENKSALFRVASGEDVESLRPEYDFIRTQEELDEYFKNLKKDDLTGLWKNEDESEEIKILIEKLNEYKTVVVNAATNYTPYLLTKYLRELAATFHKFYAAVRVLTDDKENSKAKLAVVQATIYVTKSVLTLIGATAPERM